MAKVKIILMYDSHDCDHAGCSGGEEEGGQVFIDDELVWELLPKATCFGDNNYFPNGHEAGLLEIALKKLGHEVEIDGV